MTRIVVGPFNRVEGDLEVRLDVAGGRVREAYVNSPLYRGFEQILRGREPADALVVVPRICGICSVAQSRAAALALAQAANVTPPANAFLVANLLLGAENLADHFMHFYLFFMPDFAQSLYADAPWYERIQARFAALRGTAAREVMAIRADLLHVAGILGGKWPHTLGLQPSGVTRAVGAAELLRLRAALSRFRHYLEERTFGCALSAFADFDPDALDAGHAPGARDADLAHFLHVARELRLEDLGRGPGRYMSYGAYADAGGPLFAAGVWDGAPAPLDVSQITEDTSHGWFSDGAGSLHPAEGVTDPDVDRPGGYSFVKAPRLAGRPCEVGPLARQLISGQSLIHALVLRAGSNVLSRILARFAEMAIVVQAMEGWIEAIDPDAPFCGPPVSYPQEVRAAGLIEAARGSLGHWLQIHDGRIANYQIIAPTTWNFAPRDREGVPGPLEQALVGAPVQAGERQPIAVAHIVRSFDPCMVCTVH